MTHDQGVALEAAFDAASDALGKTHLEAIWNGLDGHLAIFAHGKHVKTAKTPAEAGVAFAEVLSA